MIEDHRRIGLIRLAHSGCPPNRPERRFRLTVRPAGSRKLPSQAARMTDFRSEHSPEETACRSRPESWAGNAYLGRAMAKISPFKFLQEVRAEGQKVTWPTRKETTVTTIMVFVMVFVTSIFFLLSDQIMRVAVSFLLGISS